MKQWPVSPDTSAPFTARGADFRNQLFALMLLAPTQRVDAC